MHLSRLWMSKGVPKQAAIRIFMEFLWENIIENWDGKDTFPLQNMKVWSQAILSPNDWELCVKGESKSMREHTGPATSSHACLSENVLLLSGIHVKGPAFGLHSSSHFPLVSVSFYCRALNKEQKLYSRWAFTTITHVNHNQLHLLYQKNSHIPLPHEKPSKF